MQVNVLQEILHRYVAIDRREPIQPAFEALLGVVDEVFQVELNDRVSARDALHLALIDRNGVRRRLVNLTSSRRVETVGIQVDQAAVIACQVARERTRRIG